jgi:CBS domain-containing protein
VYSGAGCLSPLQKDPEYRTLGLGTHIFLCGGDGYIIGEGTQHNPMSGLGTLMVKGDMKTMNARYLKGASLKKYGTTAFMGIGVPIPILDEDMARSAARNDHEIKTVIEDYSTGRRDHPVLGEVSYAELKSGKVEINGKEVRVSSLSSLKMAREIAQVLKERILKNTFEITKPVVTLPRNTVCKPMKVQDDVTFVYQHMIEAITVKVDSKIKEVATFIMEQGTDHITVVDEKNKLTGFLTTFDISKAVAKGCETVKQIMVPKSKVHTVFLNDPIDIAIKKMKEFGISSLPVIDKDYNVKGLISAESIITGDI